MSTIQYLNTRASHYYLENNSLKVACILKLIRPILNSKFSIEELLDFYNGGNIIISYLLINKLAESLKIRHIVELVEEMTLILNQSMKLVIQTKINNLLGTEELVRCAGCKKILLPSNDRYYYYQCGEDIEVINKDYANDDNLKCFVCDKTHQLNAVPPGFKIKIKNGRVNILKDKSKFKNITDIYLRSNLRYNENPFGLFEILEYHCIGSCNNITPNHYKYKYLMEINDSFI